MIGIYQDNFKQYLIENLGEPVKVKTKNIVCRCPWCEYGKIKNHYHLWISTEAPIFHCFHGSCEQSGTIDKLVSKISGSNVSEKYVDWEKVKKTEKLIRKDSIVDERIKEEKVILPDLKEYLYPNKILYLKSRLRHPPFSIKSINGLIFDFKEFIKINGIPMIEQLFKLEDFFQSNFVGFLSEHKSFVMMRNTNTSSSFPHYKLKIRDNKFLDYFKLSGYKIHSNQVVFSEGIFDIFTEQIYDSLNLKRESRLYASAHSANYSALLKSISFYEQIFRMDLIILSDRGIPLKKYKQLKKYNNHILNSLTVYYNKIGKDFNDLPISPVKYII